MSYIGKLIQNALLVGGVSANYQNVNPYVFATVSAVSVDNVTGDGTPIIIVCDNIVDQQGSNYNNTTGIFTCPTDGFYVATGQIGWSNISSGHSRSQLNLQTSDGTNTSTEGNPAASRSTSNAYTQVGTVAKFCFAGEIIQLAGVVIGSTKTVGYFGELSGQWTYFSVFKVS